MASISSAHQQRHVGSVPSIGSSGLIAVEGVLLALVAGIALVVDAHKGPLPGDVWGSLSVQHVLWGRGALSTGIDDVSNLSWQVPAAITVSAVTGLLLLLRQWLSALITPLAVGVADGSNYLISQLVQRPRPAGHGIHVAASIKNFYSFPSGHVLYAVVFFGFLIFLLRLAQRARPWLGTLIVPLAALIVLMPLSRLLQGEHWPSDVLAGALWGLFWLLATIQVFRWAWDRMPALRRHIPDPAPRAQL